MAKSKYHYDNNFTIDPKPYGDMLLYQLGEMLCDSGTVVDAHAHLDWYEFTYVFSGEGTIYTNNVAQKVRQNDIYVSQPREIHKIVSDDANPLRYCFCSFNFKKGSQMYDLVNGHKALCLETTARSFTAQHYQKYFQHILSYINNTPDDEVNDLLLEYELKTLILRVIRHIRHKTSSYRMPKINNRELLCFNIINYIDTNLTTIDNISDLQDEFKYNYSYISRCFKKTTGKSISEYFIGKKLSLAKTLIEEGELSITEIANNLNYSSIYVFSRAFRERFGVSPKNYRDSLKKDE